MSRTAERPELRFANGEAEQSVLGAMLLSDDAAELAVKRLTREDFVSAIHGRIFTTLTAMHAAGRRIDLVDLTEELLAANQLEEVGGQSYLLTLTGCVPSAGNAGRYCDILRHHTARRRLWQRTEEIRREVADETEDPEAITKRLVADLEDMQRGAGRVTSRTMREVLLSVARMRMNAQEGERPVLVSTGLPSIDRWLGGGFYGGSLHVIAGHSKKGKTTLAMDIIARNAERYRGLVHNLEMGPEQLAAQLLANRSRIDVRRIRRSMVSGETFSPTEEEVFDDAAEHWLGSSWRIGGLDTTDMDALLDEARTMLAMDGLDVWVLDHAHELTAKGRTTEYELLTYCVHELGQFARQTDTCVILLAQCRKFPPGAAESRAPDQQDLRGPSKLQEVPATCLIVHRWEESFETRSTATLCLNRFFGDTGTIQTRYDTVQQRLVEVAEEREEPEWQA